LVLNITSHTEMTLACVVATLGLIFIGLSLFLVETLVDFDMRLGHLYERPAVHILSGDVVSVTLHLWLVDFILVIEDFIYLFQ